ncbi:putative enoyl-CoA hydratase [Gordonia araii NBRC 100433]|uniref:Probable enoyl-CoA hydratase EchA17 n=1 Tax=Gordonia araii NBRC 100433 TaxID=1073574 RepID=G7H592_9ACTN|nr:putative enoyl-CoA hydratase [Gordonia araii NBRC 100433]
MCVLTINRPEARNAINGPVTDALGVALDEADADPEIRAIVLTGAGDKSFCAGADLKALSRGENIGPSDPAHHRWGFAGVVSHPVSTPLIAAVNGTALGGGTELVLACDLAVSAESASFGLPEVKRGLFAAAGGAFRIVDAVPQKVAMELLLTGRPITAEQALGYGLINRVVPDDQLRSAALDLAAEIAGNAPLAVQASKRLAQRINDGEVAGDDQLWAANSRELAVVFSSEDAMEGPRAFAEKRAPVWKAR